MSESGDIKSCTNLVGGMKESPKEVVAGEQDSERLSKPKIENYNDVIKCLNLGDCVATYYGGSDIDPGREGLFLVYHNCRPKISDEFEERYICGRQRWDNIRVIYVDLNSNPSKLHEWYWYIRDAGCKRCSCNIDSLIRSYKKCCKNTYEFSL